MASPIQIVLNPENYEEARETSGGGPKKDFFAHRDREFRAHKAQLTAQLRVIANALRDQPETDLGYVRVILRREAWAKSHRPLKVLFKPERTRLVGGGDLGVMLVEARPATMMQVVADIERAEEQTTMRFVDALGKEGAALESSTGKTPRIGKAGEDTSSSCDLKSETSHLALV